MGKAPRRKQIRQAREASGSSVTSPKPKQKVKEADVLPLLQQLDAESPDERTWACASLSWVLSETDVQTRRLVASHKVVDLLLRKANSQGSETDVGVQAEALGALRNYAVEGGQEVCAEMYNKGLLPILLAYLSSVSSIVANLDASAMPTDLPPDFEKRRRLVWDVTENVLTLLWCLAESSPKALPALSTDDNLAPFLLNILSIHTTSQKISPTLPVAVPLAALHTLSTLTESNPAFALPFLHLDLEALFYLVRTTPSAKEKRASTKQLLRVLAISVLLNIINCTSLPLPPSILAVPDPKQEKRLRKRHTQLAAEIKQFLDFRALEALVQGLKDVDLNQLKDEEEVQNVQIQLEVLGQFALTMDGLASVEEEDEWPGIDQEAEDGDGDEEAMDADEAPADEVVLDVEMDGEEPTEEDPTSLISTSMGGVVREADLINTLLTLATAATAPSEAGDTISTAQNATKPALDQLRNLTKLRSIEALNNLLLTYTRAHLAAAQKNTVLATATLQTTWETLFQVLSSSLDNLPVDYKIAALGSVLACAKMGQGRLTVGQGETPFLLSLVGKDGEEDEVRTRAMAVLALLGTRADVSLAENESIGLALLAPFKTASADQFKSNLALLTQALDSLIDLYSDETRDFDQVYRTHDFQAVLKRALPVYKAAIKSVDRRKLPVLRASCDGVATNLAAFVQYRASL